MAASRAKYGLPSLLALIVCLHIPRAVQAQAGPPFLTNAPGTPGNANFEINIGAMPAIARGVSSYQVPQIDLNFGVGDRVQLTYEIPYVLQTSGGRSQSGWSNAYPGFKWRFLDQGEDGWQASIFPQAEAGTSSLERQKDIAVAGPRYLLPIEITRKLGPLNVDFEAGWYLAGHGPGERILGLVAGRPVTQRLELDAEVYDDRADVGAPHATTLDLGGRYRLARGFIALFMVGRSLNGSSQGQPEIMGYAGIQILLSDYGRTLTAEP